MKFTVEFEGVETPQGVANALTKMAAGVLGDGTELQEPLSSGPQSGKLEDPQGKCVGNWKLGVLSGLRRPQKGENVGLLILIGVTVIVVVVIEFVLPPVTERLLCEKANRSRIGGFAFGLTTSISRDRKRRWFGWTRLDGDMISTFLTTPTGLSRSSPVVRKAPRVSDSGGSELRSPCRHTRYGGHPFHTAAVTLPVNLDRGLAGKNWPERLFLPAGPWIYG